MRTVAEQGGNTGLKMLRLPRFCLFGYGLMLKSTSSFAFQETETSSTVTYQKVGTRLGFGSASSPGVCPRGQQAQGGLVLTPSSHSSPTWAAAQVTSERYHNMEPWLSSMGPGTEQWLGFLVKYRSISLIQSIATTLHPISYYQFSRKHFRC